MIPLHKISSQSGHTFWQYFCTQEMITHKDRKIHTSTVKIRRTPARNVAHNN